MSSVVFSAAAIEDIRRLAQFLRETRPDAAQPTAGLILEAAAILRDHPLIGRPKDPRLHELLISRGRSGYIGLYEYRRATDQVIVHRVRHQREAGYEE